MASSGCQCRRDEAGNVMLRWYVRQFGDVLPSLLAQQEYWQYRSQHHHRELFLLPFLLLFDASKLIFV
jgi:hypothetical protein